jgi:hypothetical protein
MGITTRIVISSLSAAAALGFAVASAEADSVRPAYGCFKVTAPTAIKASALGTSTTLAAASKGDILMKRKRFCYTIGSMCAVTNHDGIEGYADRGSMKPHPCPAKYSINKK